MEPKIDLAQEQQCADDDKHPRQEEQQQGDSAERGGALDLGGDLGELGARQIDVSGDEPQQRAPRPAELLAQTGRRPGAGRRRARGGRSGTG